MLRCNEVCSVNEFLHADFNIHMKSIFQLLISNECHIVQPAKVNEKCPPGSQWSVVSGFMALSRNTSNAKNSIATYQTCIISLRIYSIFVNEFYI